MKVLVDRGFGGIAPPIRRLYDANTTKATSACERREARRQSRRVKQSESGAIRGRNVDPKFDAGLADESRRDHAQIDSRAE